jgi:undecaprenyl-diphosphatase
MTEERPLPTTAAAEEGDPDWRRLPAVAGGILLPLAGFAALAAAVVSEGMPAWDTEIVRLSVQNYSARLTSGLSTLLHTGVWLGAAILLLAVLVLTARRRLRHALFLSAAVGGVVILEVALKELFRRPSISPEGGYSFPSGHAMATAATVAAFALIATPRFRRHVLALGVPLVLALGVPLVYAWWHYPSDILAGWCFGIAWVSALWLVLYAGEA